MEEKTIYEAEKCSYVLTKRAGDEFFNICTLNGKLCVHEGGYTCEIYEDWLKEEL